jgi:hypothetical protein
VGRAICINIKHLSKSTEIKKVVSIIKSIRETQYGIF